MGNVWLKNASKAPRCGEKGEEDLNRHYKKSSEILSVPFYTLTTKEEKDLYLETQIHRAMDLKF